MKKLKGNKGITLIALVITVIVLLILAAVSIATLTGENGLLAKADEAKTRTAEGQIDEEIRVAYNTVQIDSLNNGWDNDKKAEELQKELQKQDASATVIVDGTNLKVTYKSYETTISEDGTIGALTKSKIAINQFKISGTKVTEVPEVAGFTHTEGTTIDTGYVIQDGDGNEFVWVPVDKDQKISVNVTSEENITSLVITDPYGDDIVTESSVGQEYNNTEITPTINGPYRLAVTTESGEIKKSFLNVHSLYAVDTMRDWYVTDECAKAQGYADLQALLDDWEYETVEDLMMEGSFMTDYKETEDYTEKVKTNGGFFIGRYEAGKESDSMVIQKNKDVYNNITQIDALAKAQGYNSSVTSSLLTGAAWDRTLGWLYETGAKSGVEILGDSKSWGNYYNDSFSNTTGLIKTGEYEQTKANNIYDLAGNLWEWTTEACNTINRVHRGGGCGSNGFRFPASYREVDNPSLSKASIGFRVALYL